jgi:glycosyltransferase involved in cell wall biosynthesis
MEMEAPALRVLQVVNNVHEGDVARYVVTLSNALGREGISVGIAGGAAATAPVLLAPDVAVHPLPLHRGEHPGLGWTLLSALNLWRLRRMIRTGHYDLIHTYLPASALWAWQAARLAGLPVVHTPGAGGLPLTPNERHLIEYGGLNALTGVRRVRHYLAVSDYVREALKTALGPNPVPVTRSLLGVDLEVNEPRAPDRTLADRLRLTDRMVIALIGPLESHRRLEIAVELLTRLRRSVPDVALLITDTGAQRAALERLVQEAGEARRVVFADGVAPIPALLAFATVALVIDPGPNLSIPLLESLACGKPLLVVADTPEEQAMANPFVQQGLNGWVLPGQPAIIAATLSGVLPIAGLLGRMGAVSRQTAERDFDLRRHARHVAGVYAAVLHPAANQEQPALLVR